MQVQTVVIGAGQAGLALGYHLAQRGLPFVILESNTRVGDSWRHRWDSLRLFTAARYDGIDGMPFPGAPDSFPTKDAMADYLESYAKHFRLPVHTGATVDRVSRLGDGYLVTAGRTRIEAEQVVVAMTTYQTPRVPVFVSELDAGIVQLHASEYRNPAQLREGGVLVVGVGNSGAEIAKEVSRNHPTYLAGRPSGELYFRMDSWLGRHVLSHLVLRGLFHRVMTTDTPMGRKGRVRFLSNAAPLIRTKSPDLADAGVVRVSRVQGVSNGRPVLEDGQALDVANVIWCTGYHSGFEWIDVPVFDADGRPAHVRGVTGLPGFYFVGLQFLYAASSSMVHGVSRDAAYIAEAIRARAEALTAQRPAILAHVLEPGQTPLHLT